MILLDFVCVCLAVYPDYRIIGCLFSLCSLIGWGQIRRGVTITPTVDDDC